MRSNPHGGVIALTLADMRVTSAMAEIVRSAHPAVTLGPRAT
jgi:hypothetical protein